MKAIEARRKGRTGDGKRIWDVFILADQTPDPLPETGENVDGLTADDVFAPFSVLFVLDGPKIYIANESGVFTAM